MSPRHKSHNPNRTWKKTHKTKDELRRSGFSGSEMGGKTCNTDLSAWRWNMHRVSSGMAMFTHGIVCFLAVVLIACSLWWMARHIFMPKSFQSRESFRGFSGWLSFSPCYGIVLLTNDCRLLSKYANTTQMKYVLGNALQPWVVYKV